MSAASGPLRIAMWSGPRNLSTAMMRSWESRGDCAVSDEPFYAHYLAQTGLDHPARDEVIAAGETDWRKVADQLTGPIPAGRSIWYQKHMCHHALPHIGREWMHALANAFLIRDPAEVVASYVRSRATVTVGDIGLLQEAQLFDEVADHLGKAPPVIDADDFLAAPEAHLRALCAHFGIPFRASMLSWRAGPRESDGVWAPHWYAAVWKSTGFDAPQPRDIRLEGAAACVAEACRPAYEKLYRQRMRITDSGNSARYRPPASPK
jgi:hypothetical protein